MNVLDIIFGLVIAYLTIRGAMRGLIKEIASIGGIILGFYLANTYQADVAPHVAQYIDGADYAGIVAYVGIFLATLLVTWLVILLFASVLKVAMLTWANHLLGALAGFAKSIVLCAAGLAIIGAVYPDADFVRTAKSVPYIGRISVVLQEWMPPAVQRVLESGRSAIAQDADDMSFPIVPGPPEDQPELNDEASQ